MKEMNNAVTTACTPCHNQHTGDMGEMEAMRAEMKELKSLIAGERIVSERIIRRAMNADLSQERKDIRFSCIMGASGIIIAMFLLPYMSIPMWFVALTVAFMLTAILASLYTMHKHMAIDTTKDNLLDVARKILAYKKFGNNWLKFSLPFLAVWLSLFFYTISRQASGEELTGFFYGGLVGLVIGITCGIIFLHKSRKRLNGILSQIRELQAEE